MMTERRADRALLLDFTQPRLNTVLEDIHLGRIRLPFFHRDWCWPCDHILKLLESISLGDPIGSLMFVGAAPVKNRFLDGVNPSALVDDLPIHLVLDGQQRLTAAYQACYTAAPVRIVPDIRSEHRQFFFNMRATVFAKDRMRDAIFSVPTKADGTPLSRGINYLDPLIQYRQGIFPTNAIFRFDAYECQYVEFWEKSDRGSTRLEALQLLWDFRASVVRTFENYKLPVQILERPLGDAAICRIYKKLNLNS